MDSLRIRPAFADNRSSRPKLLPPGLVVILTVAAFALIILLLQRADSARREQLQTTSMTLALADLKPSPLNADQTMAASALTVKREIAGDQRAISRGLSSASQPGTSPGLLAAARLRLAQLEPTVNEILGRSTRAVRAPSATPQDARVQQRLQAGVTALSGALADISRADDRRASLARLEAEIGTAVALLLLVAVFLLFYVRSLRLGRQNDQLLEISRLEATTDALTGLGNRRALETHLTLSEHDSSDHRELLLAVFDLDGFKVYNDSYGHAAGDALLQRVAARLAALAQPPVSAYRMGGDEFCLLARCGRAEADRLISAATAALSDRGAGWQVGCSQGGALIPSEAADGRDALRLADQRMYANKRAHARRTQLHWRSGRPPLATRLRPGTE